MSSKKKSKGKSGDKSSTGSKAKNSSQRPIEKQQEEIEMVDIQDENINKNEEDIDKREMNMFSNGNQEEAKKDGQQPSRMATEDKNAKGKNGNDEDEPIILEEGEILVDEFDDRCEKHFHIQKVVPLEYSCCKLTLFVFLNIITVGLINIFIVWFPKMDLGLKYSKCPLQNAKKIGIYGTDGEFYVEEIHHLNLPDISSSPLKQFCQYKVGEELNITYFQFKLFKYIYYATSNSFKSFEFYIKETQENIVENLTKGLTKNEIQYQKDLFGICDLIVIIPSVFKLLFIEFADPFYLFQIFSIVLWYCTQYEYYASVIVVCTVASISTAVYESRVNLLSVKQMARYACKVNVIRQADDGSKVTEEMMSTELVPGDLFEIPDDGYALPCDCILINGTVIVNEAMLTGESTPITKNHMQSVPNMIDLTKEDKHTLFSGTKIVQKRAHGDQKVMGVVYKTGFDTVKGNLIRSILFPKEMEQGFKDDSVKYIIVMACLTIVGFAVSLPFLIKRAGMPTVEIVTRFLDLITTTVPPSLPACLAVGISYALSRLKDEKIICISRERVNLAGKINIITFDKTGTLTEDHLDVYGFRPVILKDKKFVFDSFQQTAEAYANTCYEHYKAKIKGLAKDKAKDLKEYFIECMACCHGNTVVKGKMIGDPIDVKMFQASGWTLKENIENKNNYDSLVMAYVRPKKEPDIHAMLSQQEGDQQAEDEVLKEHYELGIVRRFDFSSKLQRMTTIAKDPNQQFFKAFCKGSPEKVKDLCLPETVPEDFADILASYTTQGFRVLACATKFIKMDFMQSQEVTQEFVEKNMIFLGLLVVQNKLKKATAGTIKVLDDAHLKMVMATGDNILTAIAVSKECNLLREGIPVFSCDIAKDDDNPDLNVLSWNSIDITNNDPKASQILERLNSGNEGGHIESGNDEGPTNDSRNFEDNFPPESFRKENADLANSELGDMGKQEKEGGGKLERKGSVDIALKTETLPFNVQDEFAVACTGPTLEMLYKKRKQYLETKDEKYKKLYDAFRIVLRHGIVYARMAPEHKTLLVENFREENFKVMMCGDGANDCGALRAADVGVSLSTEEASIAAHFTSKVPDISCVVTVLREGKASLVTSIQTFKYMMMYAFIQFFAVTFLLIYVSYLSDTQYLVSDIFIILPLEFFIAQTDSYPYLTYDVPEASLLSFPILSSIIMHVITCFCFQFFGNYLHQKQDWYILTCETTEDLVYPCSDNTVSLY